MKNKGQKNGLNAAPLWLVYAAALKRIAIWTEPSEEIARRSFKELYFTINGRKKKGECFSSSNWLKLFNVWLRRRKKGPSVVVGGRCPWCWNESPAKGLPKCCCSLWKLSDVTKSVANCSHIINLVSFFSPHFFFKLMQHFCFLLFFYSRGIERPCPAVSSWESHFPCTCDSAVKQAQWNLNGKRPECILIHYRWFVTHIAVMCFCRSFCACVCVCMCVCACVYEIHLHKSKNRRGEKNLLVIKLEKPTWTRFFPFF